MTHFEYHRQYFIAEPKRGGRSDFEVTLLYRAYVGTRKYPDRTSAESFTGATRDEADQKMLDWIDRNGAVEADFEQSRMRALPPAPRSR